MKIYVLMLLIGVIIALSHLELRSSAGEPRT